MSETETVENQNMLQGGRRSLLRGLGGTVAAASLATGALVSGSKPASATTASDLEILNFALNFEYLGSEYYLRAISGTGLTAQMTVGSGTQGTVTGGALVPFGSSAIQAYAQRLAIDEIAHVNFLRAAITAQGGAPIAEPNINIGTAWTALAQAAGLINANQTFNPYADPVSFLLGAYVIEDVCVTALAGAASLLTVPANVEGAAGLLATEAYQAGAIRTLLADLGAGQATDAISTLRAKYSGVADDYGTSAQGSEYNIEPTDINSLVFRRTPAQVLSIVYAGVVTGGGFFPTKVNGTIN